MLPTKIIKVAAAAIIKEGKILVAQRAEGKSLASYWEFPGGKIEKDEEPQEAAIREIKEELDADIQIISFVGQAAYDYDFGRVEMFLYQAELLSVELRALEHAQLKWIRPEELSLVDWAKVDIALAQKLKNQLKNGD